MPPILLSQYRLFHHEGRPIGVDMWAFLSEEAEAKLSNSPPRLRPDERKSGDRCWLVDLIAPFATAENKQAVAMLSDLKVGALVGQFLRFHQVNAKTGKRKLIVVKAES